MRRKLLLGQREHAPRSRGRVYTVETTFMNDATTINATGRSSMRRTLLTLLGAVAAFGILTASYATADLPDNIPVQTSAVGADLG